MFELYDQLTHTHYMSVGHAFLALIALLQPLLLAHSLLFQVVLVAKRCVYFWMVYLSYFRIRATVIYTTVLF
jgi:predicted Kef-type K+ transport protein